MPDEIQLLPTSFSLRGMVWVQERGAINFTNEQYAGTKHEELRLEGFEVEIDPPRGNLDLCYRAYIEGDGFHPWVNGGTFVGTKDKGLRLEGFQIMLTGDAGDGEQYFVEYMAYEQDIAAVGPFLGPRYAGTQGESRRIEGLALSIRPIKELDWTRFCG
jgi:hypothetical protein